MTDWEQSQARLAALLRANQLTTSTLDPGQVLQAIVDQAAAIAGTPIVRLFLLEEETQVLRCRFGVGFPLDAEPDLAVPMGASLTGQVALTGRPLAVADTGQDPRTHYPAHVKKYGLVSYLGLPVKLPHRPFGVLVFNTTAPRTYTDDEIAYLSAFADQAAIALEHARLHEAVHQQAAVLEDRVRARTKELEEALRVKADFLAKMSHEFRTPLNFILGFTDVLHGESAGPLTPKQRQFVDRIHMGGHHLLTLVEDLLDLSMIEGGTAQLQPEEVTLLPLVQDAVAMFNVAAVQQRLRMEVAVDPGLCVVADARRLRQILSNLVGNAVKFTGEGGAITVAARTVPAAGQPKHEAEGTTRPALSAAASGVEVSVQDTGIGIPAGDLERIFLGFEQADSSAGRRYGGAGIGLALVRKLVHLHGGTVWAESAGPGQGARFVVRLPTLAPMGPKRILLVEDDVQILKTLGLFLQEAGYAVEGTDSGQAALAALAGRAPDLVVLDIGLPDVSGWDVLRHVRDVEATRALPVLVLTGLGEDQAETAKALGADEFVAKPISPRVLTGIVRNLLGHGSDPRD